MKRISACPGWLDLSGDRRSFVFVPEKAQVVREIFELSIGGLGSYAIADRLNRKGVPPFGPSPTWDHTTIDGMLRSRATLGEYQPKSWAGGTKKGVPVGAPIANYYPAVIDETTFQAAQVARQRHLATGRGRKGNNIANLFTGLTTCAYCEGPVKFHSNGDSKSLICAPSARAGRSVWNTTTCSWATTTTRSPWSIRALQPYSTTGSARTWTWSPYASTTASAAGEHRSRPVTDSLPRAT